MSAFQSKVHTALQNPTLQQALDGNAERRRNARQQAFASLPEPLETLRQRAHAVRGEVVAHLDAYLDQFIHQVQANGIIVHHAASGEDAVQIVRQIAQQHNANLISKSKTMVGEEIHLNPALEADGLQVVETDLGEYIVQLRGEPPAHIITPAVHLTRAQVGELFQEKLHLPYTEDIPTLTAAARQVLRQTFLSTDIGISGVNFGVAETGTLCLLTNEGNGRMVTSIPRVHIALMGIERLAPTLSDLALLLYLLPRSATGQKITVYASLIHAPRRSGEIDGPQERHLILVDNGRRALQGGPYNEALYCIRCGACLNACPVFREIGGHAYVGKSGQNTPYPGPIGCVISPALFGQAEFGHLARASSLCGACKDACPVDIDLPALLLRVRAGVEQPPSLGATHVPAGMSLGLRLFSWMAASPALFAAAQRLAGIFGGLAAPRSGWLRLPGFTGWGQQRDFPRPAGRPFHQQFQTQNHAAPTDAAQPTASLGKATAAVKTAPAAPQPSPVELFCAELEALGGHSQRCPVNQAAVRILELLHSRDIHAIQSWEDAELPAGLLAELRALGIQVTHQPDPTLQAGLTGALAAVAETGSLLLAAGPGRPQSASLLPEVHIALLYESAIVADLRTVLNLPQVRQASAAVLISGPSRTADIEMTLTIGVHGPRELHVLCLEG